MIFTVNQAHEIMTGEIPAICREPGRLRSGQVIAVQPGYTKHIGHVEIIETWEATVGELGEQGWVWEGPGTPNNHDLQVVGLLGERSRCEGCATT